MPLLILHLLLLLTVLSLLFTHLITTNLPSSLIDFIIIIFFFFFISSPQATQLLESQSESHFWRISPGAALNVCQFAANCATRLGKQASEQVLEYAGSQVSIFVLISSISSSSSFSPLE